MILWLAVSALQGESEMVGAFCRGSNDRLTIVEVVYRRGEEGDERWISGSLVWGRWVITWPPTCSVRAMTWWCTTSGGKQRSRIWRRAPSGRTRRPPWLS